VEIDVSPDELFGFVLIEFPPAAFPNLLAQLIEIVRFLDQVDLHETILLFTCRRQTKPCLIVMDRASMLSVVSLNGKRGHQDIE
jgi:hypothetical protein